MSHNTVMNSNTHRNTAILHLLILAIVHNFLFFGLGLGVNVLLFNIVLVPFILYLGYQRRKSITAFQLLLYGLILLCSGFIALRANGGLVVSNMLAVLIMLALLLVSILPGGLKNSSLAGVITEFIRLPIKLLLALLNQNRVTAKETLPAKKPTTFLTNKMNPAIVRGVLISIPVVIVLILLLSSADSVFAEIFSFDLPTLSINMELVGRVLLTAVMIGLFLSIVRYLLDSREDKIEFNLGYKGSAQTEVTILLSTIVVIMTLFIAIQIIYLFGGASVVLNGDLTYAEYARKGFFELLTVAIIIYAVISISSHFMNNSVKRKKRNIAIQLVLISEIFILIASAVKRLNLYQDAFGLTGSRFFGYVVMMSIALLFVFLSYKIYFNKPASWLLPRYGVVFIGALLLLNFINVDGYIAKANIDRYENIGKIDEYYLLSLSDDAIDQKVRYVDLKVLKEPNNVDKYEFCRLLNCDGISSSDWRSTNLATEHRHNIIKDNKLQK